MTISPLLLMIWLPGRLSSLVTQLTTPPPRQAVEGALLMTGVKFAPSWLTVSTSWLPIGLFGFALDSTASYSS